MTTTRLSRVIALDVKYHTVILHVEGADGRTDDWEDKPYVPTSLQLEWQSRDGGPWTLEDTYLTGDDDECDEWGPGISALPWVAEAVAEHAPRSDASGALAVEFTAAGS